MRVIAVALEPVRGMATSVDAPSEDSQPDLNCTCSEKGQGQQQNEERSYISSQPGKLHSTQTLNVQSMEIDDQPIIQKNPIELHLWPNRCA